MIKNLDHYKNSNKFKDGVSISIHTKNSEKDIKDLLENLKNEEYDEILICDESSTDNTVKIAKEYGVKVINTETSLGKRRSLNLLKNYKYKFMFSVETDQRLRPGLIKELYEKINNTENFYVYSDLYINDAKNFFEKGMVLYYQLDNLTNYPGTPFITYQEFFKDILEDSSISEHSGIDTSIIDLFQKRKIKYEKIKKISFQREDMNFKIYFDKFFWYGKGDFFFYSLNSKKWTLRRKLQSLFHVAKKCFLKGPLFCIKSKKPLYIFFFIFSGLFRYLGFFYFVFKK